MTQRRPSLPSPCSTDSPEPADAFPGVCPAELAQRIESAREEERERIARDIHDVLGSQLVAVKIEASLLAAEFAHDSPRLQRRLQAIAGLLDDAMEATRRFSRELRPGILRDFGLAAALECQAEDFARRTGLACRLPCLDKDAELPAESALALFRVFQEALTNVYKHARAATVEVRLVGLGDEILLEVLDDGCGLSAEDLAKRRSSGLRGMGERLAALGGRVELLARRPRGTRLRAILPREPAPAGTGRPARATAS